jgi:hypothetical protein
MTQQAAVFLSDVNAQEGLRLAASPELLYLVRRSEAVESGDEELSRFAMADAIGEPQNYFLARFIQ